MTTPFALSAAIALLLGLGASLPVLADTEADCRQMAQEEKVPAQDMEDFMAECMAAADSESAGAPAGAAPNEESAPASQDKD
jgi:hypothetical protein